MQVDGRAEPARARAGHWIDAIANPVRVQIVRTLSVRGERTIAQLAAATHTDPQTLRRHLRALADSGVVVAGCVAADERPGRPAATFRLDAAVRDHVRATLHGAPGAHRSQR